MPPRLKEEYGTMLGRGGVRINDSGRSSAQFNTIHAHGYSRTTVAPFHLRIAIHGGADVATRVL